METSVNRIDEENLELTFTVPEEEVAKSFNKIYQKISSKQSIPGFRKGKVPREVIKKMFGEEAIAYQALDELLPGAYNAAIEKEAIIPIGQPEFDPWPTLEEKKPLEVKVKLNILPDFDVVDYSIIKTDVEKDIEISEDEIEEAYNESLKQASDYVPVIEDRGAQESDKVTVDYEIKSGEEDDAETYDKKEGVEFHLGADEILPEIENNILGMKPSENKTFDITYPDNYPNEELANKKASINISLRSIMKPSPPESYEALVEKIGADNLPKDEEKFREQIKNSLFQQKREIRDKELVRHIVEHVVNGTDIRIPQKLIDEEMEKRFKYIRSIIEQQGNTLENYCIAQGITEEDMREQEKPDITMTVKRRLVFNRIFSNENLKILPHDMEMTLQRYAMENKLRTSDIKKLMKDEEFLFSIRQRIRDTKVMTLLRNNIMFKGEEAEPATETPAEEAPVEETASEDAPVECETGDGTEEETE